MMQYVLSAMTHVATQLTGRWLDFPCEPSSAPDTELAHVAAKVATCGLAAVRSDEWLRFLEAELRKENSALTWLLPFFSSGLINLEAMSVIATRHFSAVHDHGASLVFIGSDEYPKLLRHIARPPLFLTAIGNSHLLDLRHLAVIGSRKASYEALRMSVALGLDLSNYSLGVVSGGAIGCDIAVHEGMLASDRSQINAVIVFAGGLSSLFPRCNQRVFSQILERGGVLVSERLWYQGVRPKDFPARNRIVSGMCETVAVMAAAERSGSLITAQEALEQGRDVYVFLPESHLQDVRFQGSINLVADGARAFSEPAELIRNLNPEHDEIFGSPLALTRHTCQSDTTLGTFERELII